MARSLKKGPFVDEKLYRKVEKMNASRRKEAIKQAKIEAEFGRVQAIQDAIAEIHMDAAIASSKASAEPVGRGRVKRLACAS